MLFCATQVAEGFGQRLGDFVGVSETTKPVFLYMDFVDETILKFIFEAAPEGLPAWVESVMNGDVNPHLKSEAIPE